MAWADVAGTIGTLAGHTCGRRGRIMFGHVAYMWVNGMVPHGPFMGCYMAPPYWFIGCCEKLLLSASESNL
jgi:hypothetical protein